MTKIPNSKQIPCPTSPKDEVFGGRACLPAGRQIQMTKILISKK